MKIFFDTNVLVSAFTSRQGLCFKLFAEVIRTPFLGFVTGEVVITELERVLTRQSKVSTQDIQELLHLLRQEEIIRLPTDPKTVFVRDPDDALVLASALSANADVLVTGDDDLLVLGNTAGVKIMNPRALWELLTGEK
ncbi:MAG: putative toxin-antitoxin system toxin component, PIN family [Nitrospinae bacterium RIFCSPLOWO2_12_FULL_47_7]|nr:MAG: putative toxin-antitoxin system toxin component, PIN family [Nitrospinae bacterium RIFCSPLOWO2_12_FULL_47_7]